MLGHLGGSVECVDGCWRRGVRSVVFWGVEMGEALIDGHSGALYDLMHYEAI